jgi:hypothetical protein
MEPLPKNYVLNVEGIPNWKADQATSFMSLGLSDKRKNFYERLDKGDVIITYVKATGFVDVREVAQQGVTRLGIKSTYPDGAFPWQIRTRLVATTGLDRAISPNEFPKTKLCAGVWRYRFQQSGKLLEPTDGKLISAAIVAAANTRA